MDLNPSLLTHLHTTAKSFLLLELLNAAVMTYFRWLFLVLLDTLVLLRPFFFSALPDFSH